MEENLDYMMDVSELERRLDKLSEDTVLENGLTYPHAYRGDHMCLAFELGPSMSVRQIKAVVREAYGQTYDGFKGGECIVSGETECYLAAYGRLGEELTPNLLQALLSNVVQK